MNKLFTSDSPHEYSRDFDADLLRCIACFCVVLFHCSDCNSTGGVFLISISSFCVPVFFILSGRFCLKREHHISHYCKKSIRLYKIFLFWSVIYEIPSLFHTAKSLPKIMFDVIAGPTHFWYIYAAIALYCVTPFVYIFCKYASQKLLLYFLGISFLFGSVILILLRTPDFPLLAKIIDKMHMGRSFGFLCLYVFGYYCEKYSSSLRLRLLYVFGISGLFTTFGWTYFHHNRTSEYDSLLISFLAPNVILYSFAVYIFIKNWGQKQNSIPKLSNVIFKLSDYTLGIYLLHPLLLRFIQKIPIHIALPNAIYSFIMAALTFLLTFLLVSLIKNIPFMRKLL